MDRKTLPFWLLTLALFLAPVLPRLVTEGVFLDGLLYAVLARNLAIGVGTFWKPVLSPTLTPDFFSDHPPLALGIESVFFRVLGDHILVENLYSLLTAIVTGALIVGLWRLLTRGSETARVSWLPLFMWAAIPLVSWSYSYNMLENTLGIFTLGAVTLLLRAVTSERRAVLMIVAAGALLCAAFWSKGPLAFFPLAVVPIYWMIFRKPGAARALLYTLLLAAATVGMIALVLLHEDARVNLSTYLEQQFVTSMKGARGSVDHRWGIIEKTILELLPAIVVTGIVVALGRRCRIPVPDTPGRLRWAWLCIAIGAAASLPIVASPRQSGFYLVPSFPYYAVGLALFAAPYLSAAIGRLREKGVGLGVFTATAALSLAAVLVVSAARWGQIDRDEVTIRDVKRIGTSYVAAGTTVSVCDALWRNWSLHGYFARYYHISLDRGAEHEFAVVERASCPGLAIDRYEAMDIGTQLFKLYRIVE